MGKRLPGFVLAAAFVAACGGGASTTTTASAGASAAATSAATGAAATGAPATGAPATGAPATAAGANQPKLADLLSAGKLTQYKVTYKIAASGQGAEALSGDQTWYFKPPRSRFDFSSTVGGQKTSISVFSLPDGTFYCFDVPGSGAQCLSVGGVGSPLDQNAAAVAQRSLADNPSQYGVTFKENKTIAGQQGICYDVKPAAAAGAFTAGTFCYSKDGLALLSSFTTQGATWSMEATNISLTVPDSDFTLPAKPLGR